MIEFNIFLLSFPMPSKWSHIFSFSAKTLYHLSLVVCATYHVNLFLLDFVVIIIFVPHHSTPSLFVITFIKSSYRPKTLSLSFLNTRDAESHNKITGIVRVL